MLKKKIAFFTIGCKLNFAETSIISKKFNKKKYKIVNFKDYADFYIINTCSVTHKAEKDLKYKVNFFLKKNNKAIIIAIGCYSQIEKKKLYKIKGIKLVLGNDKKFLITNYIDSNNLNIKKKKNIYSCEFFTLSNKYKDAFSIEKNRTRSYLKIQDGCNYKCTYCTIPLARGFSRSNSIKNIINNINYILEKGIKEIVLTGVNIGDYKYDNKDFFYLIKKINKIKKLKRIRISSIEPNLLKNDIIKFISKSKKFLNHFHIPLQSGSDYILKKMKRRYLTNFYLKKINKILSIIPDACIGSDVIVGFPGENNKYFIETYNFLKSINIAYLHVFSFSSRKNTYAFKMKNKINNNKIIYRSKILRNLSFLKTRFFYKSFLGTKRKVLFENKKYNWLYGYTDNYIKIKKKGSIKNINKIKEVFLKKIKIEKNKNIIICK
ncbi:MAG: tRNA (N(6)-L-threonylcarbamoyladenosine(37)-C(2))-methylthiotransferase MtaB [Candidatus Shikimatogenerans bostrichidophilus]|nr:MAG: tRNA (N(6)-L-threonylcarbamoyladenosine(37)-C(2))-methylthiotransferase MtaB [Candidatus Shikimatogenerans bostrichidophilus]